MPASNASTATGVKRLFSSLIGSGSKTARPSGSKASSARSKGNSRTKNSKKKPPSFASRQLERLEAAWKSVDRAMLRLQGRVDTPAYDRWLPYLFAIVIAVVLINLALARNNSLALGAETAKYAQATWQITEGYKPDTSLAGGHLIADQGSLVIYLIAQLTRLFPRIETLLVVRSVALALAVVPIWRLARREGLLGIGATSALAFCYSLYSAVHFMNAADFAPAIVAVPAMLWAVVHGFEKRRWWMLVSIIAVLCCRADLGLAIAGLGLLLLIERRKPEGRIAIAVGLVWSIGSMYVLQRWLGNGYGFLEAYSQFGDSPHEVVLGVLRHPVLFAKTIGSLDNFRVIVTLLAPVLFLPLTAPRFLLPAIPLYLLYIGADVEVGLLRESAQYVPMTVFVFVATVFALRRTGRILVKRVRVERRIILALMLTAIVFFINDSASSPYRKPWTWAERDSADWARIAVVQDLPGEVPVRASDPFLPLLAERFGVYQLGTDPELLRLDPQSVIAEATTGVDWVLVDRTTENLHDDETMQVYRASMLDRGWVVAFRDDEAKIEVFAFTGIVEAQPIISEN